MITATDLELRAGSRILLSGVTLRVQPGDRIGLVGRNGAGKTTSLRVLAGEGEPDAVVTSRGLEVVSDEGALSESVDRAIAADPDAADKIRSGKVAAAGALIGAVMKEMRGQADAARVRELILEKLS